MLWACPRQAERREEQRHPVPRPRIRRTPEDVEADASHIRGVRYVVIPSLWGRMAGSGLNDPDTQFIDTQLKALLAS
jgi:hypothetical protein